MSLFEDDISFDIMDFFYFAQQVDKAGALRHLQNLSLSDLESQVLESGFSMIGRNHGKPLMMEHAIGQIGVKTPVRIQ